MARTMKRVVRVAALAALPSVVFACNSGSDTQQLDPMEVAMTDKVAPFYNDGELELFEAQLPVNLPIARPTPADEASLSGAVGPFDHHPWVTASDVSVQVTWTVANLEQTPVTVKILVDPWNEFGRYVPGVTQDGDDAIPNLSGIDMPLLLAGTKGADSAASRAQGTFSYDDMNELATDFATAINIIKSVKPTTTDGVVDDPRIGLVNHVFEFQNRSGRDPLTDPYIPAVIPGLLGFNISLETTAAANVAIEFTVETIDKNGNRVVPEGTKSTLQAPNRIYTVGGAG
jgi:hypothetical protein